MQFCATKLENKDNFSKSDPYYTISKTMGPGHWSEVARSNYIKDTLNPSWPAVTIPVSELCNGDYEKQIKFSVFDHDDMGNNDMVRRNNVAHAMPKERKDFFIELWQTFGVWVNFPAIKCFSWDISGYWRP
jgi:hypothetical protein